MLVLQVAKADIGGLVQIVLEQAVNQLEEDLVAVLRLDRLVLGNDRRVIDDVDLELDALAAEVLRVVVFGMQVTADFAHTLNLGDGKVLP